MKKEYNIKSAAYKRDYQAIPYPPMGYQMQIDIGIVTAENIVTRKYQKLYCIGFVLSNSRHKYGVWYDYPPTASNMVNAIKRSIFLLDTIYDSKMFFNPIKVFL